MLTYLNKTDRKLVLAAHNRKYEEKIKDDPDFWDDCAKEGYLDLLVYEYQKINGNVKHQRHTCIYSCLHHAAWGGHIHVLKWAINNGFKCREKWFYYAVENRQINVLKWILGNDLHMHIEYRGNLYDDLYEMAVLTDYVDFLDLLKEHNILITTNLTRMDYVDISIEKGCVNTLKWLLHDYRTDGINILNHIEVMVTKCHDVCIKEYLDEWLLKQKK